MEKSSGTYWKLRLTGLKRALEANKFEVFIAQNSDDAKRIIKDEIFPKIKPRSIAWGGSITFTNSGLYDELKTDQKMKVLDTLDNKEIPAKETHERRRQAFLADLFITGTNAVTEAGQLVNLDMVGNRVAAINFGPEHVIIMIGRNKMVENLEEAMIRIKNYVAPANAIRLGMKTPCVKTSYCEECKSTDRICNVWTITEKSFPAGRVKIVLINEDMGL